MLLSLAVAGVIAACSDAGSVDPDAIPDAQKRAVWMALDSAFRHDTTLDPAFTGDSGLYALMSTLVIPFVDRASRIAVGGDTTRAVGIEFDIDATQGGTHVVSNLTAILAWRGYDSTSRTIGGRTRRSRRGCRAAAICVRLRASTGRLRVGPRSTCLAVC
jgi:hypothetical protein